ncbi:MAG: hypothetical protein RLZZ282_650 [Verrucomicrobiota bacterium]
MTRIRYGIVALLVLAFGALGLTRLSFNVDLLTLLPRDLPGVAATVDFQKFHDRADELLITLQSCDGTDVGEFTAQLADHLRAAPGLTGGVQYEPAWRTATAGLSELTAHAWLNAPPESLLKLEAQLAPPQIDPWLQSRLGSISESLNPLTTALGSRDPLGFGSILSEALSAGADLNGSDGFASDDGSFHLIKLKTGRLLRGYRENAQWFTQVQSVVNQWQKSQPDAVAIKIAYTGSPAFESEIGTGMENDMSQSLGGITFMVGFLFWLFHRRLQPLFYLMLAMVVTGLLTLGVAGLSLGALDVMSMGFAAILMGMIEDFGVMGLHEAMRRPTDGFRAIHTSVFPSIAWSALTSAAVFGALGLSTLPGIARMGMLTSLGILIGAVVMLYGFLPLAMRHRGSHPVALTSPRNPRRASWPGWLALILLLFSLGSLALRGLPSVNNHTGVLRPRHCMAFAALLDVQKQLQPDQANTLWLPVLIHAPDAPQLAASLHQLEGKLTAAKAEKRTLGHLLPSAFVPDPTRQLANLPVLIRLAAQQERLLRALDQAGFTTEGMTYSRSILETWAHWGRELAPSTRWPSDDVLENLAGPVLRRDADGITACGFVLLPKSAHLFESTILSEIQQDGCVRIGGFDYLSAHLKSLLRSEVKRVLLPAAAVLGILFFLVFRNSRERLMAVGSLVFSAVLLLGVMSATGMTWNFVNIGAVPLSLGLGLDFNIHMIHALRERGADGHGIGRALAYCGLSTGLGFGALGLSDNGGLASFGQASMIGVLATLLTAAFFVPWAWRALTVHHHRFG